MIETEIIMVYIN